MSPAVRVRGPHHRLRDDRQAAIAHRRPASTQTTIAPVEVVRARRDAVSVVHVTATLVTFAERDGAGAARDAAGLAARVALDRDVVGGADRRAAWRT